MAKREIDKTKIDRIERELRVLSEALDDKYRELAEAEMADVTCYGSTSAKTIAAWNRRA